MALKDLAVLVVDDSATSRHILQEFLVRWQIKPTLVDSAAAALTELERAAAAGRSFPLMLVDTTMQEMNGFALVAHARQKTAPVGTFVMMLSSAGQLEESARCRELGLSAYLTKPVRQSELLDAIVSALGHQPAGLPATSAASERILRGARPLQILLTEDNPVNQRLAVRILEKWGHSVVVAGNGHKALEAFDRQSFDLVLMDVQMPEMSGLEATAEIRKREEATGRRVPIIAMTAHAMEGDREKCLAAGMDHYVTKPIDQQTLFAAIESCCSVSPLSQAVLMTQIDAEPNFDPEVILRRVDGDRELMREVATLFLEETPRLLSEIRQAVARNDTKTLERSAHTLKGSVGNFGAKGVFEAALALEQMGRQADCTRAQEILAQLERHVAALVPALQTFMRERAA
jgi:CheY-like chemotaxis protein